MRWRTGTSVRPARGFILPCFPTVAKRAPTGPDWVYELKHDGYRLLARKDGQQVVIYSRNGANFTGRFPRIVEAVRQLRVRSILIDGEGIAYDERGMPSFALIHSKQYDRYVSMVSFDLLEIDGDDVRRKALLDRKKLLAKLRAKLKGGIEFNEHLTGDGTLIFKHACKLGHEGIVAKRIDLPYESGRSKRWLKIKNPDSPAAKRIEDETF